jgi:hypothetical protein
VKIRIQPEDLAVGQDIEIVWESNGLRQVTTGRVTDVHGTDVTLNDRLTTDLSSGEEVITLILNPVSPDLQSMIIGDPIPYVEPITLRWDVHEEALAEIEELKLEVADHILLRARLTDERDELRLQSQHLLDEARSLQSTVVALKTQLAYALGIIRGAGASYPSWLDDSAFDA